MTKLMNSDYLLRKAKILQDSGVAPEAPKAQTQPQLKPGQASFEQVLSQIGRKELKFSKHALERLSSRQIELSPQELNRISEAVDRAEAKGVKEALILMNDKVFIASVKSKTIITASTEEQLKNNVFTQIDGAVII